MKIQTVSLIGLGAIGAAYGRKLQQLLGDSFTVVASKERIDRYNRNGITINGERAEFSFMTPDEETAPRDFVIFATKNAELQQAIKDMKHHIGKDTIILSLLNGISSEEEIINQTGNAHVLYSLCVGIDAVRQGHNITYSSLGKIVFGEKDKSISDDVIAVKQLFDEAGVPYEVPEDVWHAIWAKFMFNVGVNQTSAVLKAPYKHFQQIPELQQWMESAMYEVVEISKKAGINLTEKDILHYRPILQALSPNGKTSMLQDVEAKRKTEVEFFAGKVCELGKKYNIPTPVNEQLYKIIRIMEQMW